MDTFTRETVPSETKLRRRRSRLPGLLACLVVLIAIGAAIALWPAHKPVTKTPRGFSNAPVPVLTSTAAEKSVPIWIDGLGTVQAYQTVTVTPMVGGPLVSVDFTQGQDVKKGQVLAKIDSRTYQAAYDEAVAKKAQDQAQLANAKVDLARYEKLVKKNYTTAQTADTQKATVAQLTAQVESDQAAIENAKTLLSYTTITAPITGRTGILQVDAGNIVQPTSTTGIVTITQLKPISVLFSLPQQDLGQVQAAMAKGKPKVLALDGSGGPGAGAVLDTGTLAVLDNTVDPSTGTIKLKATFPNPQERLWPGAFVRVRLESRIAENAVTVPPAAVQRGPNGDFVFTVSADHVAHLTPVTVGYQDGETCIITKGLKPGDVVVTDGASRLADGKKVSLAPAAGEPAPAAPAAAHAGKHRS